jgi:hypothetical protein
LVVVVVNITLIIGAPTEILWNRGGSIVAIVIIVGAEIKAVATVLTIALIVVIRVVGCIVVGAIASWLIEIVSFQ